MLDVFPETQDQKIHLVPPSLDAETPMGLYAYQEDPAEEGFPDRHLDDAAGSLDLVPLLEVEVLPEDNRPDGVLLEVESETLGAIGELEHLPRHAVGDPVDLGDSVPDLEHRADLIDGQRRAVPLDLFLENRGDLVRL